MTCCSVQSNLLDSSPKLFIPNIKRFTVQVSGVFKIIHNFCKFSFFPRMCTTLLSPLFQSSKSQRVLILLKQVSEFIQTFLFRDVSHIQDAS